MAPIVDGLEASYGERVAFLRLDAANQGREAFVAYGLRGHPSYVIIDSSGTVQWKGVGEQARERLDEEIRQVLDGG